MKFFGILVASVCILLSPCVTSAAELEHFQSSEFPKYFLPQQYWVTPPDSIPPQVIAAARQEMESTLSSLFNRITLPLLAPGTRTVKNTRVLPLLKSSAAAISRELQVHLSGGVLRSGIAYCYREIYLGMQQIPPVTPEETLRRIRQSTADIPGLEVLGKGSDFDVLLDGATAQIQAKAAESLKNIIDSAAREYGITSLGKSDTRLVVAVGDIKPYEAQTARSSAQGGSSIDWMTFDATSNHVRAPPRDPQAFDRLLRGGYEFFRPEGATALPDTTLVRGFRPLTELPFLQLTADSERFLNAQLSSRLARPDLSLQFERKALTQFDKLIRNSFPAAANNRLRRARPGSSEALFLELANKLSPPTHQLLPTFTDYRPIRANSAAKSIPKHLLTPYSEFVTRFTDGGFLYHGTPTLENALAVLRQGLVISGEGHGRAQYGRGAYTTPTRDLAMSYANQSGMDGMVLALKVKEEPLMTVLEWERIKDDPWIKELEGSTGLGGKDLFPVLAKEYGVDVIINKHVLVQNSAVFKSLSNRELVFALQNALLVSDLPIQAIHSKLESLLKLRSFLSAVEGGDGIPLPVALGPRLETFIRDSHLSPEYRMDLLRLYKSIVDSNPSANLISHKALLQKYFFGPSDLKFIAQTDASGRFTTDTRRHSLERVIDSLASPTTSQLRGAADEFGVPLETLLANKAARNQISLEHIIHKVKTEHWLGEGGVVNDYEILKKALTETGNNPELLAAIVNNQKGQPLVLEFFIKQPEALSDPSYLKAFKLLAGAEKSRMEGPWLNYLLEQLGRNPKAKSNPLLMEYLRTDEVRKLLTPAQLERHKHVFTTLPRPMVPQAVPRTLAQAEPVLRTRTTGLKVEWLDANGIWQDSGLRPPPEGITYSGAHLDGGGNLFVELRGTDQKPEFLFVSKNRKTVITPNRMQWSTAAPPVFKKLLGIPGAEGALGLGHDGTLWKITPPSYPRKEFIVEPISPGKVISDIELTSSGDLKATSANGNSIPISAAPAPCLGFTPLLRTKSSGPL